MKRINHDELYQHLSGFLKAKGVEFKEGSYPHGIRKGCQLLADAINLSQQGLEKAKTEIDKKLDQMRQVIHEKTAPKPPPASSARQNPPPKTGEAASPAGPKRSARRRTPKKSRATRK